MDDTGSFTRQRRNLMLISFALGAALFLRLQMTEISLLGSKLAIPAPTRVWILAWAVWGYFLFRYWQVFEIKRVKEAYSELWPVAVLDEAIGFLKKHHQVFSVQVRAHRSPNDVPANLIRTDVVKGKRGLATCRKAVIYIEGVGEAATRRVEIGEEVELAGADFRRAQLRTLWRLTVKTPTATEYLWPFVFALLIAAYGGCVYLRKP